jgi:Flp pilus assembly protein TadD
MSNSDDRIEELKQQLAEDPKHADLWHELDCLYGDEKGDFANSIEAAIEAVKLEPKNPMYWVSLGASYASAGQFDKAIEVKEKAIELEPENARYQNGLGVSYYAAEQFDKAIDAAKKAIELEPENAKYQENLGVSYHEAGLFDKAIEVKEKAIELEPENARYQNGLGVSYYAAGQFDKAIAAIKKAIELEPKNAEYQNSLGTSYHAAGQFDKAIAVKEKAIELEPENARYQNNLSIYYYKLGQYDKSIKALKKALQLSPSTIIYQYNLGQSYLKSGKKEDAKKCFDKGKLKDDKQDFANTLVKISEKLVKENDVSNLLFIVEQYKDELKDTQFEFISKIITSFNSTPDLQNQLLSIQINIKRMMNELARPIRCKDQLSHYSKIKAIGDFLIKKTDAEKKKDGENNVKLRLNSASYMNDPSEGVVLIDFLKQQFANGTSDFIDRIFKYFGDDSYEGNFNGNVYLFSFTSAIDTLPMWTQYGERGEGCCLVLTIAFLI